MGITYNIENEKFTFDFEHDGVDDIINLTGKGYQVKAFGQCFHYAYEFADDVQGSVRSAFIKYLKFPPTSLRQQPELTQFIQRAIDNLHHKINLYDYDLVVTPESSIRINNYMARYIYRFAQPRMRSMEYVKTLSEKTSLDDQDEKLWASIHNNNVLVVDDIATSGSTLNEVMRALRVMNEDNKITIFSLIGRQDLMAESI